MTGKRCCLRARVRAQTGEVSDLLAAVEDLKEVLVQEPNSRPGLYFMAQANFNLGNMDQARAFAGDLERNYPDYIPAKLMQVQISLATGDTKSAHRLATELIDRVNQTAPDRNSSPQMLAEVRMKAYLSRGSAALEQGNTANARKDFMMARDVAPRDTYAYISLASVALAENKFDEAVGFYENALSIESTNFNALSGLIRLYARNNDVGRAHARMDQVLSALSEQTHRSIISRPKPTVSSATRVRPKLNYARLSKLIPITSPLIRRSALCL